MIPYLTSNIMIYLWHRERNIQQSASQECCIPLSKYSVWTDVTNGRSADLREVTVIAVMVWPNDAQRWQASLSGMIFWDTEVDWSILTLDGCHNPIHQEENLNHYEDICYKIHPAVLQQYRHDTAFLLFKFRLWIYQRKLWIHLHVNDGKDKSSWLPQYKPMIWLHGAK